MSAVSQVTVANGLVTSSRPSIDRSRLIHIALWAAAAWVVVFWKLGYPALLDPDESHYAQITREMMAAHQWLVPLRDGVPFIDKPVLFHWLQAFSFSIFGMTEFAARVPTALAGLVLTCVTAWTGRELFGPVTGRRAALMFVTMPATFALGSVALLDMMFAAALFSAAACLIVAAIRGRGALQWAGYALLSVAIMIKGPVAVLLLAVAFVLGVVAVPSARTSLLRLRWFLGPTLAVAVAAPWFLWMWGRFGDDFLQGYFVRGNVWYITHPFQFRQPNYFFYMRTLFGAFLPWSLLYLGRLIDRIAPRQSPPTFGAAERLFWMWSLAVVGVFTVARFKLDTYVYPAAPAICLIAARAWDSARDPCERAFAQRATIVCSGLLLVAAGVVLGWSMFDLDLRISPWAIVVPMGLAGGGALFVIECRRLGWRPPRSTPVIVPCTLLFLYGSAALFAFPVLNASRPTPEVGGWISSHQPEPLPVGSLNVSQWTSSLRYYSERRVIELGDHAAVPEFFSKFPRSVVVMRRRDYRALTAAGLKLRVLFGRDAVTGMQGRGLRRQVWGRLVVVGADTRAISPSP